MLLTRLLIAVALLALVSGCATITRGTTQPFYVETDPPGAKVRLSTGETCITPCELERRRKTGFDLYVEKPGYEPAQMTIVSGVSGSGAAGLAGNVLFGGVIGVVVDGTSGAMRNLTPNPAVFALLPMDTEEAEAIRKEAAEKLAKAQENETNPWPDHCPQNPHCSEIGRIVSVQLANGEKSDRRIVALTHLEAGDRMTPQGLEPPDLAPQTGYYYVLEPDEYNTYYALVWAKDIGDFREDRF